MADYQHYQPRRSAGGVHWRRWLFIVIGVVAVWMLGRSLFGGTPTDDNANVRNENNAIRLVTDNANTDSDTNLNGNGNLNVNAATSTAGTVSLDKCAGAISSYGDKPVVALTFNVAAANQQAEDVLTALKEQKITADFFVSGTFAAAHPDFVQAIIAAGFNAYNRTNTSPDLTTLSAIDIDTQLSQADQSIVAAGGRTSKPFMRPPQGAVNEMVVTTAAAAGYCTILWTVDGYDWSAEATVSAVSQRVNDKLRAGAIIMLSAGYDATADAIKPISAAVKARGYTFVTLSDLMK